LGWAWRGEPATNANPSAAQRRRKPRMENLEGVFGISGRIDRGTGDGQVPKMRSTSGDDKRARTAHQGANESSFLSGRGDGGEGNKWRDAVSHLQAGIAAIWMLVRFVGNATEGVPYRAADARHASVAAIRFLERMFHAGLSPCCF